MITVYCEFYMLLVKKACCIAWHTRSVSSETSIFNINLGSYLGEEGEGMILFSGFNSQPNSKVQYRYFWHWRHFCLLLAILFRPSCFVAHTDIKSFGYPHFWICSYLIHLNKLQSISWRLSYNQFHEGYSRKAPCALN